MPSLAYRVTDSPGGSQKQQLNMRLTAHARKLLARLAMARGVSQTDIVEMMIREEAERRGIVVQSSRES
jgi:uncharacterized protein (DUF1778 family)